MTDTRLTDDAILNEITEPLCGEKDHLGMAWCCRKHLRLAIGRIEALVRKGERAAARRRLHEWANARNRYVDPELADAVGGDVEGEDAPKQALEPCTEEGCRKHHYLHHDASRERRR
jgi:hypothetical protein